MKKDISRLNFISFTVYHLAVVFGLLLFMLMLIPIRIMLSWCTPPLYWRELGDNIHAYIDTREEQWKKDWVRLGGTL